MMNRMISVIIALALSLCYVQATDDGALANVTHHHSRQLQDEADMLQQPLDIWSSLLQDWTLK